MSMVHGLQFVSHKLEEAHVEEESQTNLDQKKENRNPQFENEPLSDK